MDTMNLSVRTSRAAPMTRADLDAMPDDGYRHELIDGVLVVTPAPSWQHQWVVGELNDVLRSRCPDELKVFFAPIDVALADDTVMQPDLLVTRLSDLGSRDLPVAPLLAVEILSPSTHRFDLMTKRSRYEAAGAASYWVVDPIDLTLIAWDLVDGAYVEVAHVTGDEAFTVTQPFDVTIVPTRLRD